MTDTNQSSPEALLEAECYCRDGTCHYCRAVDEVKALRRELDEARTVTREQVETAVKRADAADDQGEDWCDALCSVIGLTITDTAEGEGRQCDCPEVQAHGRGNVWHFACRKSDRVLATRRCIITEDDK